jgi:hypothetical protein
MAFSPDLDFIGLRNGRFGAFHSTAGTFHHHPSTNKLHQSVMFPLLIELGAVDKRFIFDTPLRR